MQTETTTPREALEIIKKLLRDLDSSAHPDGYPHVKVDITDGISIMGHSAAITCSDCS